MITIGFTGTRHGMNKKQHDAIIEYLDIRISSIIEAHHGDCLGADAQFDSIAKHRGITRIIHPPKDSKYRAYCEGEVILAPKEYLDRNMDIAIACTVLVATPLESNEQLRSGTWSTIRYARKMNKEVIILER